MSKYKLHIPQGVKDIIGKECYTKHITEEKILNIFRSYGYHELQSPTFEYYDVFEDEDGLIQQETMFKFFDRNGRILVLRPDITTPIARIVATKFNEEELPLRLCYIGNAFRYNETYQGEKMREFTQAGIELIGINGPDTDAEVLAITIKSLLQSGLKDFQIEIGHADFVNGLLESTGLNGNMFDKLKMLIDNKNSMAINELLEQHNIEKNLRDVISNLSNLFGDIDILERLDSNILNSKSKAALENIKDVYSIIDDYGLTNYISIDLGLVQSINYYTGIIFKGFTHGVGFPICSGGRYDGLISKFGKNYRAIGVSIGIDRLLSALERNNAKLEYWNVDTLVAYDKKVRKLALNIADDFREQGLKVEFYHHSLCDNELIKYCKNKNIGGYVKIESEDSIILYNIASCKTQKTTINELLNRGRLV